MMINNNDTTTNNNDNANNTNDSNSNLVVTVNDSSNIHTSIHSVEWKKTHEAVLDKSVRQVVPPNTLANHGDP